MVKPFLSENAIKVKIVDKWCKVLIYLLFHMSSTKKHHFLRFLLDRCWWRHRLPVAPPLIKYTSSCWEDQRLSTKGKILSKYCNITKTLGRGSINPPPPCTTVRGMNLRARPRVNKYRLLTLWFMCLCYLNGDLIQK